MSEDFLKSFRLRTRRDFERVAKNNQKRIGKWIIIDVRSLSSSLNTRLGITVTRKFGKAHDRNRFKRIVREAFRLSYDQLIKGVDVVVRPKCKQALMPESLKMQDIQAEFKRLLM